MRKWLSRLTFSFLVIAAACGFEAWEGFNNRRPVRPPGQNYLLAVLAGAALVLFLISVKIRHDRDNPPE